MSRINQNISSMVAQRTLGSQNMSLNKSLQRLSTGLRINRGADDPAGLIASENLRSEKAAINAATSVFCGVTLSMAEFAVRVRGMVSGRT